MSRPSSGARRPLPRLIVATFLIKLAKHLALLVCCAIIGHATGRMLLGQFTILALAVAAGLLHGIGRAVKLGSTALQRDAL
jgi:hypothetical protein